MTNMRPTWPQNDRTMAQHDRNISPRWRKIASTSSSCNIAHIGLKIGCTWPNRAVAPNMARTYHSLMRFTGRFDSFGPSILQRGAVCQSWFQQCPNLLPKSTSVNMASTWAQHSAPKMNKETLCDKGAKKSYNPETHTQTRLLLFHLPHPSGVGRWPAVRRNISNTYILDTLLQQSSNSS